MLAQALATVEVPVQRMRARVEPLLDAEPLATAREARNEECTALVRLMGSAHLGEHEQSGAYILRSLSVVALWRLRRVSRSFRRWGTEALAAMQDGESNVSDQLAVAARATQQAAAIDARPAVKRGKKVNRLTGHPAGQLHERHDASDFELRTQDKIGEPEKG